MIGINAFLATLIIIGYCIFNESLPENAVPNRIWLMIFCMSMSFYIIGDTYLLILGFSNFLVEVKYTDDYIKIVIKLYVDFFGFWGSVY